MAGCGAKVDSPTPPPPPAPPVQAEQTVTSPPPVTPAPTSPGRSEYQAALALMAEKDMYKAVEALEKAVELDPNLAEAWNDLSYAYLRRWEDRHARPPGNPGGHKEEIEAARKALALKPDWAFAQYNLGAALLADGQYPEAVEPLRRSAEQQPERPEPLAALGLALLGAGKAEEAIQACLKADAMDVEYVLGARCLELARHGFKRLPDSEAAIGHRRYEPGRGFVWTGPAELDPKAEFSRVSPPWYCSWVESDGFRTSYFDCRWMEYRTGWSAQKEEAGKTPAGIGVGSPWNAVIQSYGDTYRDRSGLHYAVADLDMTIHGSEVDGVLAISFSPVSPFDGVDDLVRDYDRAIPEPPTYGDEQLAGVEVYAAREEVEATLAADPALKGRLSVAFRENKAVSVSMSQGTTPRGLSVGDPVAKVRRLYGKPSAETGAIWWYHGEHPFRRFSFYLGFELKDGRVTQIHLSEPK